MESSKINYEILARYVSGECSEVESDLVKRAMEKDSEFASLVKQFEVIKATRRAFLKQSLAEKAWGKLNQRIESAEFLKRKTPEYQVPNMHFRSKFRKNRILWVFRAAAVLFVAGLTTLFTLMYVDANQKETSDLQEVETTKGQRSNIHLNDGSRILMNSNSLVSYLPFTLDSDSRAIHMTGEAFFDVTRDERSFIVHVDGIVVQVHGTEFAVRSYQDEDIQVTVVNGIVSVKYEEHLDDRRVFLERGDMITIPRDNKSNPVVYRNVDLDKYVGWKDYRFTFDNVTLKEVARKLERVYGVEIVIQDPELQNRRISTRFEGESIQKVLSIIQIALNIEYTTDGARVHIYEVASDSD